MSVFNRGNRLLTTGALITTLGGGGALAGLGSIASGGRTVAALPKQVETDVTQTREAERQNMEAQVIPKPEIQRTLNIMEEDIRSEAERKLSEARDDQDTGSKMLKDSLIAAGI